LGRNKMRPITLR